MKARFCIGFAILIILLTGVGGSAQTSQGLAANMHEAAPRETWVSEYISTDQDAGSHVSIAFDEDNGNRPWIAYYNQTNHSLMVAHFTGGGNGDCAANDDWVCDEVDTGGVGQYNSIDVYPDTNPDPFISTWKVGVSYYDEAYKALKYAQLTCHTLICAWTTVTVDSPYEPADPADSVGKYSSLEFGSDGTAHISYYRYIQADGYWVEQLFYTHNNTSFTNCGEPEDWYCYKIDFKDSSDSVNFAAYTSLDLDYEDNVWISYYDGYTGDLRLATYVAEGGNCDLFEEWSCWVIDDGGGDDTGLFTSLHAPQRPEEVLEIAYYNKTAGELRYAFYLGTSGNCGPDTAWQCTTIDSVGADLAQMGLSLWVNDLGSPLIAYMDASDEMAPLGLKVASPAYFQSYANCGSGYYSWYCREVDNGGATQEEAEFLALGVKPNGLAMIAYSERDTYAYPEEYNLKIAYQTATSLLPLVVK